MGDDARIKQQENDVEDKLKLEFKDLVARAKVELTKPDDYSIKNYYHWMSVLELKSVMEQIKIQKEIKRLQARMNTYTFILIVASILLLGAAVVPIFQGP